LEYLIAMLFDNAIDIRLRDRDVFMGILFVKLCGYLPAPVMGEMYFGGLIELLSSYFL